MLIFFWGLAFSIQAANLSASSDSTHTLRHVLKIHLSYPDSAHSILDAMETSNLEPLFLIQAQRAMIYGAHNKHRLVINYGQKALQHDSLQTYPKYYLQTLTCCVEAYRKLNEHNEAIHLLEKGLEFARAQKNLNVVANLLFTAGQTYYQLNKKEEAYQYFQEAIRLGEEGTYKQKPYLSYFYGEVFSIYFDEGKYQEALEYCNRREKLIHQMSSFKQIPTGYIDQQYAYLYSKKACVLSKLNRKTEAATHYHKFQGTRYSHTPQGQESILAYWMEIDQYDAVVQFYQQQEMPQDTITSDYVQQLAIVAKAYEGKKEYKTALDYQKRLTAIKDSLSKKNMQEELAELATIYQLKEKENEIQQQQEQIQKAAIIRDLLVSALALVCLLLWMVWYHLHITQKKNRLMVKSMNAVLDCEQKIETLEKEISSTYETEIEEAPVETDTHLFKRMEQLIKEEKLFLNPDLNRQDILNKMNIDKNRFAKIMQENLQMTLPQYLSTLRVKYAIHQFKEHPNYTIQAIADESGFNNLRSFQRIFKAQTGMTPSEYKTAIEQAD